MMFNPKHRKKIQMFWTIFAVIVALSMVLMYVPSLYR
jgi:hypothetical protein